MGFSDRHRDKPGLRYCRDCGAWRPYHGTNHSNSDVADSRQSDVSPGSRYPEHDPARHAVMPGQDESGGEWTLDTLYIHINAVIGALDRRVNEKFGDTSTALNAALTAAEKAVIKAEVSTEKRFEAVNEFRGQLADQARTLMPRAEAEARIDSIQKLVDDLSSKSDVSEGRVRGNAATYGLLIAVITVIIAVVTVIVLLSHSKTGA